MRRSQLKKDPADIKAREETLKLYDLAKSIFRYSEDQWEKQVQLLPLDKRQRVRQMLDVIKEHKSCRR